MAAASRKPRFSPCAPIGGKTWAASPISASLVPVSRATRWIVIGNAPRPPSICISPSMAWARRRISAASSTSPSAASRSALLSRISQTRLERCGAPGAGGRGTSVNGPSRVWNSVEESSCGRLWRSRSVIAVWPKRRAVMSMPAALRAGEARPSAPTISGAVEFAAVVQRHAGAVAGQCEIGGVGLETRCGAERGGQDRRQNVVLDIPAEQFAADLAGAKLHGRRRQPGPGVVDDSQRAHRRRYTLDVAEHPEVFENVEASPEQGDGAAGRGALRLADQRHLETRARKTERGGEAGQASADNHDIEGGGRGSHCSPFARML